MPLDGQNGVIGEADMTQVLWYACVLLLECRLSAFCQREPTGIVVPSSLQPALVDTGHRVLPHGRGHKCLHRRRRVLLAGRNLGSCGGSSNRRHGSVHVLDILNRRNLRGT